MKGDKGEGKVQHISITPKSAIAIVPPKKVIRALYDYEAQSSQELSFSRGDFFHVIGRENSDDWYEACNPAVPDARGLVPVAYFQALGKTLGKAERDSGQSDTSTTSSKQAYHPDSGYSDNSGAVEALRSPEPTRQTKPGSSKGTGAMVYGIVMYDFSAERPDELEAKAGEAIIVIAQSNPEWFVAKPIGRLGGPGLIPVSFIEIRDMGSGQAVPDAQEAVQRAGVPKVEEWKKMAADYKNSSITLGKFEVPSSQQQALEQSMDRMSLQQQAGRQSNQSNGQGYQGRTSQQSRNTQQSQQMQQSPPGLSQQRQTSQLYAPISAQIPRFCFAEEKYWFVIEAQLENGSHWELSRFYEDFYDFQIALLTEFPAEAGNTGTQKRSLPYMPGPVNYVTDSITDGRRHNLDAYVKNLLTQPPYISRCQLVKQFFAPRDGDYETDPNSGGAEYRMSDGQSRGSSEGSPGVVSQQSSQGNLNGNGYPGLSAPPRQTHSRGQPSVSSNAGAPNAYRQESSLSQPSNNSLQSGQPLSAMKVKIAYGDDVIAIRVPTDVQYQELHDKIRDRLKIPVGEEIVLSYKDESSGERPALMSNNDLDFALGRNDKLMIYVD